MRTSQQETLGGLEELTTSQILYGVLMHMGGRTFSEQAVYRLFENIQRDQPHLAKRYRLFKSHGELASEPLRRILSILEMSQTVEIFEQYYRMRRSFVESIHTNLTQHGVLPRHEELLRRLADQFLAILAKGRAS